MILIPFYFNSCKNPDKEFRFDCRVDATDSTIKWIPSDNLSSEGIILLLDYEVCVTFLRN